MILVVDDDKSIRLSLKLILERNEFEVVLAEEPHAAIQGLWVSGFFRLAEAV